MHMGTECSVAAKLLGFLLAIQREKGSHWWEPGCKETCQVIVPLLLICRIILEAVFPCPMPLSPFLSRLGRLTIIWHNKIMNSVLTLTHQTLI